MSGKYLIKVIQEAKEKDFEVSLFYLFLETQDENIYRVKNRVLNGGHNVPVDDVIRRYYRSRKLFWHTYKDLVDNWVLFFNGDDNFELIANNEEILDEDLFQVFYKGMNDE